MKVGPSSKAIEISHVIINPIIPIKNCFRLCKRIVYLKFPSINATERAEPASYIVGLSKKAAVSASNSAFSPDSCRTAFNCLLVIVRKFA